MAYNLTSLSDSHIVRYKGGCADANWRYHSTHERYANAVAAHDRLRDLGYVAQIETRDA